MPGRLIPFVTNEVYHVFNRGIDRRPTFIGKKEYGRAKLTLQYYRHISVPLRLSYFLDLKVDLRDGVLKKLEATPYVVEILAYCLMPNHFHFLLRQVTDNGVSKFLSNFQNSYTRYFNTKHKRVGPLFLDQCKAVRIETLEQLLHVSRYIHLNPATAYLVKDVDDVFTFPWSSLHEYESGQKEICETDSILRNFEKGKSYEAFVRDQADYQRKLEAIHHLLIEENP